MPGQPRYPAPPCAAAARARRESPHPRHRRPIPGHHRNRGWVRAPGPRQPPASQPMPDSTRGPGPAGGKIDTSYSLLLVDHTTLHYPTDPAELIDILQRVSVVGDDVGVFAHADAADILRRTEELGRTNGRRLQHLYRR